MVFCNTEYEYLVTLAGAISKKSKFPANQAVAVVHAGIGVTPMISMLHNIAARVRDRC